MSQESVDVAQMLRRSLSYDAMEAVLKNVAGEVVRQEPLDPVAVEYVLRLQTALMTTEHAKVPYERLRRSETTSMWLRHAAMGEVSKPDPDAIPGWVQSVQGVDTLVVAQLAPKPEPEAA